MKKFLLFGNHSCANRGDAAISRGLIENLEMLYPGAQLDFYTRYPGAGNYILGRACSLDVLGISKSSGGVLGALKKLLSKRVRPLYFYLRARYGLRIFDRFLASDVRNFIIKLREADVYLHVGGSFFVDVYGVTQFEGPLLALSEKKPVLLIGHSVGPFTGWAYNRIAKYVFETCTALLVREQESVALMNAEGISIRKVISSADTAWLVNRANSPMPEHLRPFVEKPTVAITVRDLAPFDRRLNFSQEQYENALLQIIEDLIAQGFRVVFASTCTGLDSYGKDDRIVALRIRNRVVDKRMVCVVMDELTDNQLADLYGHCRLVLATRLHSAILAMRSGTPAIAIYYEHKSQGILFQMGLHDESITLQELPNSSDKIISAAKNSQALKERLRLSVEKERALACETISKALSSVA